MVRYEPRFAAILTTVCKLSKLLNYTIGNVWWCRPIFAKTHEQRFWLSVSFKKYKKTVAIHFTPPTLFINSKFLCSQQLHRHQLMANTVIRKLNPPFVIALKFTFCTLYAGKIVYQGKKYLLPLFRQLVLSTVFLNSDSLLILIAYVLKHSDVASIEWWGFLMITTVGGTLIPEVYCIGWMIMSHIRLCWQNYLVWVKFFLWQMKSSHMLVGCFFHFWKHVIPMKL